MAQPKFDWIAAIKIVAVGIGLIMLLVAVGGSPIGIFYPSAQ